LRAGSMASKSIRARRVRVPDTPNIAGLPVRARRGSATDAGAASDRRPVVSGVALPARLPAAPRVSGRSWDVASTQGRRACRRLGGCIGACRLGVALAHPPAHGAAPRFKVRRRSSAGRAVRRSGRSA
jgi:hypothetical protein